MISPPAPLLGASFYILVKKLPWTSLALLLVTYSTFGWLLYAWKSWPIWLMGAVFILVIAWGMTAPGRILNICVGGALQSDTKAFISIILGSFAAVVLLRWFAVFANFLLLLAAAMLARLDMQIAGFSQQQAFWLLAVVSLAGFGIGLAMHQVWTIYPLF